jgi:hypothetical protein
MSMSFTQVQSDVEISNALQSITALVPDAVAMAERTIRCVDGTAHAQLSHVDPCWTCGLGQRALWFDQLRATLATRCVALHGESRCWWAEPRRKCFLEWSQNTTCKDVNTKASVETSLDEERCRPGATPSCLIVVRTGERCNNLRPRAKVSVVGTGICMRAPLAGEQV